MLFTCTLKNRIVYVPTVVKTEAGFYMRRDPVAVVPAAKTDALWGAFHDVMEKGNETVPTPKRDAFPIPVLPKYAGAKSWAAFMKGASEWAINEDNGIARTLKEGKLGLQTRRAKLILRLGRRAIR